MNSEQSLEQRAAGYAALGEPMRLAIAEMLALADASPGELGQRLEVPSNLLAHHLHVLESAGVIERHRSEGDRRRTYVRLAPASYRFIEPRSSRHVPRVVFVCTQNSARSQLAAALWAGQAKIPVASAGTRPTAHVHPRAVAIARRHGIELRRARTSHVDDVIRPDDLVVAVCDHAYEEMDLHDVFHWSEPDPANHDNDEAFASAFASLAERVDRLARAIDTTSTEPVR